MKNEITKDGGRPVMNDAEESLRATANLADKQAAATRSLIEDNLQVVKQSMVAAETAVMEHLQHSAKGIDPYVSDNVWNWR